MAPSVSRKIFRSLKEILTDEAEGNVSSNNDSPLFIRSRSKRYREKEIDFRRNFCTTKKILRGTVGDRSYSCSLLRLILDEIFTRDDCSGRILRPILAWKRIIREFIELAAVQCKFAEELFSRNVACYRRHY